MPDMFMYPIPALPPEFEEQPVYGWVGGVFSDEELNEINTLALSLPPQTVVVGTQRQYKPEYNRSVMRWIEPSADTDWIYNRITTQIAVLNSKHYRFDLIGLDEPLNYLTYTEEVQGHYFWHVDTGENFRKLSITVQMTDPAEYDGGEVEINASGKPEDLPKDKGKMIMFPSYLIHRVKPVTRGARSALVAWSVGPPFR